jgi:hypothetical protein
MCLDINGKLEKKIAETDIICYKHLKKLNNGNYLTPYQLDKVSIGETYESEVEVIEWEENIFYQISRALHSFADIKSCKKDADEELKSLARNRDENDYVICRCVIPKGSEYYVGDFAYSLCYASNKIKYVKVVKILRHKDITYK